MIFADGVGLGKEDSLTNPFFAANLLHLSALLDGNLPSRKNSKLVNGQVVLKPLDATLGIQGLPQSGTGQATIFTGMNAARLLGQHFGPYPHSKLKPLLSTRNLFLQLQNRKKSVCFVNAYPRQFHDAIHKRKLRYTVTTFSAVHTAMPLRGYDELKRGEAISADITGAKWEDFGYDHVPLLTPREAGRRFYSISRQYNFTLFEYFLTDHAGHSRKMPFATEILERLDGFLGGVLENFNPRDSLLLFTSDHGNIEDLTTKSHTRNPVPLLLVGRQKELASKKITSLSRIAPTLIQLLSS